MAHLVPEIMAMTFAAVALPAYGILELIERDANVKRGEMMMGGERTVPGIVKFRQGNLTLADMAVINGMVVVPKGDSGRVEGRGSGRKVEFRNGEKNVTLDGEMEKGVLSHGFHHGKISMLMDDGRERKGQWIVVDRSEDGEADGGQIAAFEELHQSLRLLNAEEALSIFKMLEEVDRE